MSESSTFSWENLLDDTDAKDIDSVVSRELGPLHRPPNFINLRRGKGNTDHNTAITKKSRRSRRGRRRNQRPDNDDDEVPLTLVEMVKQRRVGLLSARVILLGAVLGALCAASFATSTLILDTFQLRPEHIMDASQLSMESQKMETIFDPNSQRFVDMKRKLLGLVSDPDTLNLETDGNGTVVLTHTTPLSPQLRALDWLANRDSLQLDVDAPNLVQRYALAVLFYSTNEAGWTRDYRWLSDKHECEWSAEGGIRACTADKQVADISLWNNLKGTIPKEIGELTKVRILYLARNNLYGTIPPELGLMTDLTYVGLHHNRLTGTVPSKAMKNMTNLKTLYLQKNFLTGTIRRVDPLCQLRPDALKPKKGKPEPRPEPEPVKGQLARLAADCKSLVKWKGPQIACGCCTKCYI